MVERATQQPRIVVNEARIAEVVKRALDGRVNKEGIFQTAIISPEEEFIELARIVGKERDSEVFALHALFFIIPTLFADNSTRQLRMISRPSAFRRHSYLFDPEEVLMQPREKVIDDASDLIGQDTTETLSMNGNTMREC